MPSPRCSAGAFTLVELLVVLGVIAILVLLGFPAFSSALRKGKDVECMNHLKQWGSAIQAYAADHDNQVYWYPGNDRPENAWVTTHGPYRAYFGDNYDKAPDLIEEYRKCPGDDPKNGVGYAFIRPRYSNRGNVGSRMDASQLLRLHSLPKPSKFLLMTDAWDQSNGETDGFVEAGGGNYGIEKKIKPICEGTDDQKVRHGGKVHVLFADFHIGAHNYEDFRKNEKEWMLVPSGS